MCLLTKVASRISFFIFIIRELKIEYVSEGERLTIKYLFPVYLQVLRAQIDKVDLDDS